MNYKMIAHMLGRVLFIIGSIMLIPLILALADNDGAWLSFLIPSLSAITVGAVLTYLKPKNRTLGASEGFVIVALSWIIISIVGAIPFSIKGWIPGSFLNCLFESISGFTTSGATVIALVEDLPRSILLWRSLTMWLGGMGVLVFVIAVLPKSEMGVLHVFAAESPGPQVGKFVSKIKRSAQILYLIYIGLTLALFIFLVAGGMPVFDSINHAFTTTSTGGFSVKNASIGAYNNLYFEIVIGIFMLLSSLNFNLFYFMLIRKFRAAFKSEEILSYMIFTIASIFIIASSITSVYGTFAEAFRHSFFNVYSVSSTTGYGTTDLNSWPVMAKVMILFIMVIGGCAGSTAGGLKMSRFLILSKSFFKNIDSQLRPRHVKTIKFDGKPLDEATVSNVNSFFAAYVLLAAIGVLLISIDPVVNDVFTSLSATLTSISNIGPILSAPDAAGTAMNFSGLSKSVMMVLMLIGRLEIFPILFLFYPKTWRK